ncbi:hypothetical protein EDC96DRAFT_602434 [Choanephora cucurbitarum]|nr:hypothetical protein EDC96DRAFT_602434 [Choanephora cucurbitarum]
MTQIMFETFNAPALYVSLQPVLSLYAAGRTTGVALDSGDSMSHVASVYEGYAAQNAIQQVDLAGGDTTTYLGKILPQNECNFSTATEMNIMGDIKEKLRYLAVDYEKELAAASSVSYALPDGKSIVIGSERCIEAKGIHRTIYNNTVNSILLSGGTTLLPGITKLLQEEIGLLVPPHMKINALSPFERRYSAWI